MHGVENREISLQKMPKIPEPGRSCELGQRRFRSESSKWSQIHQQEGINTSESGFYGSTRFVIMWEMSHKTFKLQRACSQCHRVNSSESKYSLLSHNTLRLQSGLSYLPSNTARFIPVADKSHQRASLRFCLATFSPWFSHSGVMDLNALRSALKLKG